MLKTGLSTNLKLETRIDPALILRSELVELPLLQLESRIQVELTVNPFLEVDYEMEQIEEPEAKEEREEEKKEDDLDWEEIVKDFSTYEDSYTQKIDRNEEDREFQVPVIGTIKDSLEEQLYGNDFNDLEKEIALEIIGNIDGDGYLSCPLFDIAKRFEETEEEVVENVLKKVQMLDPIGIGSRDVRECLLVQLSAKKLYIEDAYIVLRDYYNDFVNKRYERIMKRTGIEREQMKEIIEEIIALNPKPGVSKVTKDWEKNDNAVRKQDLITPDFYVREVDGELKVMLNNTNIPNMAINSTYSNLIMSESTEKNTKDFVKKKLESARWFINAIYQRKMTLNKVMNSIVKFQNDFFFKGPEQIRPLILKTVAEDISMDVATISRCTKEKYVDTDFGIFELKYFFTEKLATQDGGDVSTTIVKERIREIIEEENKKKPLSDQKISELLKEEGHTAARRTVQKYREQLRIPVARLRKEVL